MLKDKKVELVASEIFRIYKFKESVFVNRAVTSDWCVFQKNSVKKPANSPVSYGPSWTLIGKLDNSKSLAAHQNEFLSSGWTSFPQDKVALPYGKRSRRPELEKLEEELPELHYFRESSVEPPAETETPVTARFRILDVMKKDAPTIAKRAFNKEVRHFIKGQKPRKRKLTVREIVRARLDQIHGLKG